MVGLTNPGTHGGPRTDTRPGSEANQTASRAVIHSDGRAFEPPDKDPFLTPSAEGPLQRIERDEGWTARGVIGNDSRALERPDGRLPGPGGNQTGMRDWAWQRRESLPSRARYLRTHYEARRPRNRTRQQGPR